MRKAVIARDAPRDEATLSAALHSLALSHLPSQFYLGLQLALPAAVQFWAWGWHRSAGCMVVASAFGIWALGEQALDQAGDTTMGNGPPGRLARAVHWTSGLVAGGLTAVLLLDLVLRFLGVVFKCPGCAG